MSYMCLYDFIQFNNNIMFYKIWSFEDKLYILGKELVKLNLNLNKQETLTLIINSSDMQILLDNLHLHLNNKDYFKFFEVIELYFLFLFCKNKKYNSLIRFNNLNLIKRFTSSDNSDNNNNNINSNGNNANNSTPNSFTLEIVPYSQNQITPSFTEEKEFDQEFDLREPSSLNTDLSKHYEMYIDNSIKRGDLPPLNSSEAIF